MKNLWIPVIITVGLVSSVAFAQETKTLSLNTQIIKGLTASFITQATVLKDSGLAEAARVQAAQAPEQRSEADVPVRKLRKLSIDLSTITFPEGPGLGVRYTPVPPVTIGLAGGTTVATVAVSAEAEWNIFWKSNFTPILVVKFTNLRFTGVTDKVANMLISKYYNGIELSMAGQWMNFAGIQTGFDYVSRGGFHFFLRGGVAKEVGTGGQKGTDQIIIHDWLIPTMDLGFGGSFKWL